jgi:replication factor C subunit 1
MIPRLKGIARSEKLVIEDLAVEKVAEAAHGDMRQAIGLLHMLALDKKGPIKFTPQMKTNLGNSTSSVDLGLFDAVGRLLASNEPISDRMQYYFVDSSFVPLLVQENYISSRPHFVSKIKGVDNQMLSHLEALSTAADSISDGDLVGSAVWAGSNFELMPVHAIMSSVKPASVMRGALSEGVRFSR